MKGYACTWQVILATIAELWVTTPVNGAATGRTSTSKKYW